MNTLAVVNDAKDSAQEPYSQNSTYSENQKQSGLKPGLASTRYPLEASTASYFESRIRHNLRNIGISDNNMENPIQQMMKSGIIQPKLKISQPEDPYEIEADRIADQIMRMPVSDEDKIDVSDTTNSTNNTHRKCSSCDMKNNLEKEKEPELKISRKPQSSSFNLETSKEISNQIINTGEGNSLDSPTKSFMETRFGHDFGSVRIHDDAKANGLARAVNARAFTFRNNIFIGKNESTSDKRLMAHELTHVVQQNGVIYKTANNEPQIMREEEPNVSNNEKISHLRNKIVRLRTQIQRNGGLYFSNEVWNRLYSPIRRLIDMLPSPFSALRGAINMFLRSTIIVSSAIALPAALLALLAAIEAALILMLALFAIAFIIIIIIAIIEAIKDGVHNHCILLYEQCDMTRSHTNPNWPRKPCDDCLRECIREESWPFYKCPIGPL